MENYARITFNEKTELIIINEDLVKRNRIIDELSMMWFEVEPMLNVPDEDKEKPLITMPHLFEHSESDDIGEVIDAKIEQFSELMTPIILNHFNIKLKKKQLLYFGESYQISKDDLKNGITMHYCVEIIQ
jgi:hypothetical protein